MGTKHITDGDTSYPIPRNKPEKEPKMTVIEASSELVDSTYRIIRFRGRPMIEVADPYPHFVPLHKERFETIAYPVLGGIPRSRLTDVFAYVCSVAVDLTDHERYILFGATTPESMSVWDTVELRIRDDISPDDCVFRCPYPVSPEPVLQKDGPLPFVMSLAGGDLEVYADIMQSLAPIIMDKKPDGVIWWTGDGANGKSTLMDAVYRMFPGQLSSLTMKRLTDGRDTPSLNGTLANIVKESSEGRIDDTEIYKNIGTHENFRVHKFHSQDDMEIRGNLHHIFSANSIPVFNDKGHSVRRRTFVIPFRQHFESNPTFEQDTFTQEMFGRLIRAMMEAAQTLRDQGYRYKWSALTTSAKANYDAESSNAEEYVREIIADGIVAFDSFNPVRIDYDNWCADNGYVPLGVGNMRKALQNAGFERISYRTENNSVKQRYFLPGFSDAPLIGAGLLKPGMYTTPGFSVKEPEDDIEVPEFKAPVKVKEKTKTERLMEEW